METQSNEKTINISIDEKFSQTNRNHELHFLIGEHLKFVDFGNVQKIIDPACGGEQHIPLFLTEDKSRETQLCKVDFMIIKDNKIKIIIEIEESDIKPTQILGKLLTSAIARYYIHKTTNNVNIPMADNVCFIQILDTIKLPVGSKKREQWENIEVAINEILPSFKANIKTYKLFYGNLSDINLNEISRFIKHKLDD